MSRKKIPENLATREFVLSVIEDMRTVLATPGFILNMDNWAYLRSTVCYVCAGGSAVIFGLGGPVDYKQWSEDQWDIASWCDAVRRGRWDWCEYEGHPVPESAQKAWDIAMMDADEPEFFPAWERFANALPSESESQ